MTLLNFYIDISGFNKGVFSSHTSSLMTRWKIVLLSIVATYQVLSFSNLICLIDLNLEHYPFPSLNTFQLPMSSDVEDFCINNWVTVTTSSTFLHHGWCWFIRLCWLGQLPAVCWMGHPIQDSSVWIPAEQSWSLSGFSQRGFG